MLGAGFKVRGRDTGSLRNESLFEQLLQQLNELGAKINRFIQAVAQYHNKQVGEDPASYGSD